MRKILVLLLAVILLLSTLVSCRLGNGGAETPMETPAETPKETPAETPSEDLPYDPDGEYITTSAEMDYIIKKASFEKYGTFEGASIDQVKLYGFLGEYDGAYAIKIKHPSDGESAVSPSNRWIGECLFVNYIKCYTQIFKDGDFYDLEAAYYEGVISESVLEAIQKEWNGGALDGILLIDKTTDNMIEEDYKVFCGGDTASILYYYGEYNGTHLLFILGDKPCPINYIPGTVGGVDLSNSGMIAYKDGAFCSVAEAYQKGLVTSDDLSAAMEIKLTLDDFGPNGYGGK